MKLWFENKCKCCGKEFNDQEMVYLGGVGTVSLKPQHILVDQAQGINIHGPVEYDGEVKVWCRPCFGEVSNESSL